MIPRRWKYSDLEFIVAEAMRKLPYGDDRFRIRGAPSILAVQSAFFPPEDNEMDFSDRDFLCGDEQIEAEYKEEITQIEKLMYEHKLPLSFKRRSDHEPTQRFREAISIRAHAMHLWDTYAVPWRVRDDDIYIIYPPRDMNGSPIIRKYKKKEFVRRISEKLADVEAEKSRITLVKDTLMISTFILAMIMGFIIFSILGN